ncbi:IS4 family transposase [Streptomyces sp. NPDC060198]|uniref:IS4 family transposase n=1 Tax=Streptomyces sp. NPDC060198 TaxID=3347070 RepID=UPI00365497CE
MTSVVLVVGWVVPRPGQVKSSGVDRLSDRIALGVLRRAFPPELVDEVVAECGRVEQRTRLLPARVVVYFVLAMCLFFGQGYEVVARLLVQGLEREGRWAAVWRVPTTAAIGRARLRLGPEPLRVPFARVCRPVSVPRTPGAWYRQWRLVAVDGTVFDVPDTAANAQFFGRPGTSRGQGRSAYPQARVAALAECGTHAVFAAEVGPLTVHETVLARQLFPALTKGMLLLADRGFCGFDLWRAAKAGGADLLSRVLGLPEALEPRFVPVRPMAPAPEQAAPLTAFPPDPEGVFAAAFNLPTDLAGWGNLPVVRVLGSASAGGVGPARGLARMYAAAVAGWTARPHR